MTENSYFMFENWVTTIISIINDQANTLIKDHTYIFYFLIGISIVIGLLTIGIIIMLINQIRIKRMLRQLLAGAPTKEPKKEDEDLTE